MKISDKDLFKKKYLLEYNTERLLEIAEKKIESLTSDMNDISGQDISGFYLKLMKRNQVPYSANGINAHIMNYFKKTAKDYFIFCFN